MLYGSCSLFFISFNHLFKTYLFIIFFFLFISYVFISYSFFNLPFNILSFFSSFFSCYMFEFFFLFSSSFTLFSLTILFFFLLFIIFIILLPFLKFIPHPSLLYFSLYLSISLLITYILLSSPNRFYNLIPPSLPLLSLHQTITHSSISTPFFYLTLHSIFLTRLYLLSSNVGQTGMPQRWHARLLTPAFPVTIQPWSCLLSSSTSRHP